MGKAKINKELMKELVRSGLSFSEVGRILGCSGNYIGSICSEQYKNRQDAYTKAYYKENKEKINTRSVAWAKNNPEKVIEYQRNYREKPEVTERMRKGYVSRYKTDEAFKQCEKDKKKLSMRKERAKAKGITNVSED